MTTAAPTLLRTLSWTALTPQQIRSALRPAMIGLIALLVHDAHVAHWLGRAFDVILAGYGVVAVAWLILILRARYREWFGWVSMTVDVAVLVALCIASGPATIALYPIFFLLPVSVAFLQRPAMTATVGLGVSFGYLLAWLIYAGRDDRTDLSPEVFAQVGCLLWLTLALTALSLTLARRAGRVRALLDLRRRLVAESMRADERHNRELSEYLHDGALQSLLAARLDLEDLRENPTASGFDRLDGALRETLTALRTTVATLHPQVLAQVGLTTAIRELTQQYEDRRGAHVHVELDDLGRPDTEGLTYRAARELLANAHKHSRASRLDVSIRRSGAATVLRVADDGIGFDSAVLTRRVAEGHIGLASLVVEVEAIGGSMDLAARAGGGTVVTVEVPDHLPRSGARALMAGG